MRKKKFDVDVRVYNSVVLTLHLNVCIVTFVLRIYDFNFTLTVISLNVRWSRIVLWLVFQTRQHSISDVIN